MTHINGYPLPATSGHDEHGNHIPPHIPAWRAAAGTDRVATGAEVERNQRLKQLFNDHLKEHRRRGESDTVTEEEN